MIGFNKSVHALQGSETHGSRCFAHLAIRTDAGYVIKPGETEVSHPADLRGKCIVIGRYRASFKGIEELCGMETEHFRITKPAHPLTVMSASERMGGIEHQLEVVFLGERA